MIKTTTARIALILSASIGVATMTIPALAQSTAPVPVQVGEDTVPRAHVNTLDFNLGTASGTAALTRYTHRVIAQVCAVGKDSSDHMHREEYECRTREFAKADEQIAMLHRQAITVAQADIEPKPDK